MTEVTESYVGPGPDWREKAWEHRDSLEQAAREEIQAIEGAAWKIMERLLPEIQARLAEIGDGQSCETHAARAREAGRFQVVTCDMWDALGLPRPDPAGG